MSSGSEIVERTKKLTLRRTGDQFPMVGFGLWKVPKDVCSSMVVDCVKAGYRHFDGACDYGNEKEVGEGLKKVFDEGLAKREELWLTSKLWNTYHKKEHVRLACERTLKDLGVEYLDLYLIHFPIHLKFVPFETRYPPEWVYDPSAPQPRMEFEDVSIRETWEAMEELVEAGLVRNIGVSNFNTSLLRELLTFAKIKPAVLQVELHPFLTQERLLRFCAANEVHVTAYSSFGGTSYIELGGAKKSDSVLEEGVLKELGEKYKKSPAQIALMWAVGRGTVVIPKTSNQKRLIENIDLFDVSLTEEEIKSISALDRNRRFNDPGTYCEFAFNTFCPIFD
mmetsp:Transcript_27563/g.38335  ORF Transcript_27563/g.38335 Transcript_27563/m.38335 type:complete len:337 (-) Transcript_27563:37-1047(-)|eukprot:CAMPEP_0201486098 /NCGR_PEP_ID=MMETSP0151_2-20130828/10157_1 /ASSEMBLY_ACC=CAM_ASM_000257 /TAXON_ID=200890 /ORGANISM="Paramoeba atlantica, Strain 621/1 / CCAP 1560/9" /LENGTH=336 /DNA_ID=CAMNT_0047870541 /DNA_START=85 /DNA_END=1095 /DNA_ORIENTATION=+